MHDSAVKKRKSDSPITQQDGQTRVGNANEQKHKKAKRSSPGSMNAVLP